MKRLLLILTTLALLLLCACGVKESFRDHDDDDDFGYEEDRVDEDGADRKDADEDRSDTGARSDTLGDAVRSAWLDAIDESGSSVQCPDIAGILSAVLDANPDISGDRLEEAILDALRNGEYQMIDLPESDGSDDDYLDALEVMLAEFWIDSLSELEPIQIDWGD